MNSRKKNILIGVLLVGIISMTIVYAASAAAALAFTQMGLRIAIRFLSIF